MDRSVTTFESCAADGFPARVDDLRPGHVQAAADCGLLQADLARQVRVRPPTRLRSPATSARSAFTATPEGFDSETPASSIPPAIFAPRSLTSPVNEQSASLRWPRTVRFAASSPGSTLP
jgi:hypothetical protein